MFIKKCSFVFLLSIASAASAQNAQLTGLVKDPSGACIARATVTLANQDTGAVSTAKTNAVGFYNFSSVIAGRYAVKAEAKSFAKTMVDGLRVETSGDQRLDIELSVPRGSETITVQAGSVNMNTEDASVSTVVNQALIGELPLNGRSLDTLFLLTPGVVPSGTQNGGGQYSVNGQRSSGNQLTVDGASGNVFLSSTFAGSPVTGSGQTGVAGSTYATSASGGTNGLLPVDAIEEYRMETSTYSAEYGRSPGGQIQMRTRGGTNTFHGSVFEYFRNQVMDATDWFVKYNGLKQSPLRMNDFGGTVGGTIFKNKLFFFVAHETLDLDQPNSTKASVPSAFALQSASATFAPLIAAFPKGNGGTAATSKNPQYTDIYNAAYATKIIDHSTSARFDANLPGGYKAFFRFNLAPSSSTNTLWDSSNSSLGLNTYTGGVTKSFTSSLLNELTANYSTNHTAFSYKLLPIDGGDPSGLNQFCSTEAYSPGGSSSRCTFTGVRGWTGINLGVPQAGDVSQWNVIDKLHWTMGRHSLTFGTDFRRLLTSFAPYTNDTVYLGFFNSPTVISGTAFDEAATQTATFNKLSFPVDNLSLFAQDAWHITSRLTVNYGLRWEYNPPVSDGNGGPLALIGSSTNLSSLVPAPTGTPLYRAEHGAFAPRLGFAYQLQNRQGFATVLRAGAGIFYDTGQAATTLGSVSNSYPYVITASASNVPFSQINFKSLQQSAPAQTLPQDTLYAVDPHLTLPYTGQWNLAVEQQLFGNTSVSATYLGADGEKLGSTIAAQGLTPSLVTPTDGELFLLTNRGRSNYQALQLQATVRAASGIDALVAYTYSHNLDNGTSDFSGPSANVTDYWGNADNDIRHVFSAGMSLRPKGMSESKLLKVVSTGWVVNTFIRLQTATPLSVFATIYTVDNSNQGFADRVPGVPVYKHGPSTGVCAVTESCIPGGVQLNPAAFADPPRDPVTLALLRDGDSGRNAYRLFGLHEFDLSTGRKFAVTERVGFEFKAEAFNILNTPTFANVQTGLDFNTNFGQAQNTYSAFTGGNGGQNSTFQLGGARNIQLTGRLTF
ncbi:TonB-dependent receptor [Granulicella sp. L60]|uniref:TonB-dependent receptor n=1 Tax=Granulicella sp. L60 TaxID=1641866 RepID=UPI001C20A177|nr:TonB-dependent receptor [Granulicella sp. L60]